MKLRSAAALAAALVLGLAAAAEAQYEFFPYYGKNRVLYEVFPWKTYETEHFKIFFYTDDLRLLKNVVGTAESAYRQISQDLKHDLAERVPLLYYTTFTDFEQSNVFQVSEGVLGVSEPVLYRIGIHGDMTLDALQNLVTHELTHIFEFDVLWGRQGGALTAVSLPPLWTFEGLSEYATREWSAWSTLILRDAILNDRIPEFSASGELFSRYPLPREPAYDFGHAIYEFIVERYGANAIRDFWQGLKGGSRLIGRRDPIEKTFRLKPREFHQEFKKFLRSRVKDFLARENPEDYSVPLGPEFPINPYYFAFSHAVSPSGDLVATITFNARAGDMDIVLLSAKDGKVLKNITKGYSTKYETIKYEIDPSQGKCLAWSPEGDRLAFFAREGRRHSLFIISALTGETLRTIDLPVDQPSGPCFTRDGTRLLFGAFVRGIRDLFAVDLAGGAVSNLTNDDLFEKAPAVSPDGATVAYSIRVGAVDELFLSPLADFRQKKQLTFGPGQTISPEFSADGRTLYFAGDAREAYNVYSLDLESGELRRHTDVRTGNFYPAPLPDPAGGTPRFIFSSFNKGAFQLFRSEGAGVAEPGTPFVPLTAGATPAPYTPALSVEVAPDKIAPHDRVGKLFVTSRPPVDVVLSTDGSIYGGSALAFSDILGERTFAVTAYQVRDFQSFDLAFLNQHRRFQWMVRAFKYAYFYYPYAYYYDPTLWSFATTADAIMTREIKGATAAGFFPLNKYYRLEASFGFLNYSEDTTYGQQSGLIADTSGYFVNGSMLMAGFSLTGETTLFKSPYGPAAGHTFQLSVSPTLPVAKAFIRNTTFEADLRKYFYLGSDFVAAFRWRGFASVGRDAFVNFFGGNNTIRSADYYAIIGTKSWFFNAELRFPLVSAAQTILGPIGPFRGALFFDVARSKLGDWPAKFYRFDPDNYETDPDTGTLVWAPDIALDAIGSYGYGIQAFLLGLPVHFEWSRRIEWRAAARPFGVDAVGPSVFRFWIGYDF
jgi:Tol biopolymer transport system component